MKINRLPYPEKKVAKQKPSNKKVVKEKKK